MAQTDRIRELEENLAEVADILTHLCWGKRGSAGDDIHARSFEVADKTAKARDTKDSKPTYQTGRTGRKFR